MDKPYTVYQHTFPNGKKYIGITCQPVLKRWAGGLGYKQCPKMYKAILKYGWENVEHAVLYEGIEKAEAEAIERYLIAYFNTIENGYNIDHGGNTQGTHSIETRRKISAGNKGKKMPPMSEERKRKLSTMFSGEGNPFYGKAQPQEVREAHSAFMKGNQYNAGNHHTDDYKKWKSEQMKGKYSNGGNPRCKAVIRKDEDGNVVKYYSLRKAATDAAVSAATMHKWISRGSGNGYQWRYENG